MSDFKLTGRITPASGGTSTEFVINDDGGWQQWGGTTEELGNNVDFLEGLAALVMEHFPEATEYGDPDEQDDTEEDPNDEGLGN